MNPTKDIYVRTKALYSESAFDRIRKANVIIFGIGGVGAMVAEALGRSGVGGLTLVDFDRIEPTNTNRQIHATEETVGQFKAMEMKRRLLSIDSEMKVEAIIQFYEEGNKEEFHLEKYDYVIDAIDSYASKISLILTCKEKKLRIISAMGAGNKTKPDRFRVADIYKTSVCPLARKVRSDCRKNNVTDLKVVFSDEPPIQSFVESNNRKAPGSLMMATATSGLMLAGEVIRELVEE